MGLLSSKLFDWVKDIETFLTSGEKGKMLPQDEEKKKKLKALGYLQ